MVGARLRKIWNPELFQGTKRYMNYFEGWYYKLVDRLEDHILAVIPGIALGATKEASHAFIQFLNGKTGDYGYFTFSIDDFIPSPKQFEIAIKSNYFSANGLRLDLQSPSKSVRGELRFEQVVPYPRRLLSPGIMGWGSFVPFVECKHGIVSMNHTLQGTLEVDGTRIAFDGGKGYIEKDWGRSFPSSYIWMQSNHFAQENMAFMLSIARIPWLHTTFTGFAAALWYNGRVFTFATYTGAKITQFEKGNKVVRITISDRHFELHIEAIQDRVWELKSPDRGEMTKRVLESLTSTLNLQWYEKTKARGGKRLLVEDQGRNAGLELMDEKNELFQ
ncbi:MAG: hypothetical protein EFT35_09170 [Methanophagales archaeon ANME-1-THS]|nr:MAG: hypothetical protein EFT35_09170 [Methanophagales archaeon ANME-1-THS]